jgi:hypothetical protein
MLEIKKKKYTKNSTDNVAFEFLSAVADRIEVLWDVTTCIRVRFHINLGEYIA